MVDIAYDNNVKLVISAETPLDEIYTDGIMKLEFERTKSRLHEMQTLQYWQQPHLGR